MNRLSSNQQKRIRSALLNWYQENKRDLPWRKTKDPYKIWISEVMLQQTQVKTVEPYYRDFIARFPDVNALARASLDAVLKQWEGLGYYSRARNLHKGAQFIVSDFASTLPSRYESLLEIPGIGPYTAGAIASIAFNQNEIVIDGNVRRVMARILLVEDDPKKPRAEKHVSSQLKALLPKGHAGDFNQALMELGATICTPNSPTCSQCPVEAHCAARAAGLEESVPMKSPRKARPHYNVAIGIIWKDERVLITKRPEDKLLGGLWEFPGGKQQENESIEDCLVREISEELDIQIRIESSLPTVDHGYTHFTVTLHPFECNWVQGDPTLNEATDLAWIKLREIEKYAFPRGNKKILAELFERDLKY